MSKSIATGRTPPEGQILSLGRDFLVQVCARCKREMLLAAGDIIYGESWYHDACWREVQHEYTDR